METTAGSPQGIGDWRQNLQRNFLAITERYDSHYVESLKQAVGEIRVSVQSIDPWVVSVTSATSRNTLRNAASPERFQQAMDEMQAQMKDGVGIVVNGLGNGAAFDWLYRHHPTLYIGMGCPFYIVERSWNVLAANLMIHDWVELLRDPGVHLFIGENAVTQLEEFLREHIWRQVPTGIISGSTALDTDLTDRMANAVSERAERVRQRIAQLSEFYARIPPERFAEMLSASPPRRPRVYLVTTLFSTVLQYSTRDLGEAFERLGFDVLIDIEPDVASRGTNLTMAEQLWNFKPDLVVQIDHARFEMFATIIPPQIPFITWIQDRMDRLYTSDAGAKFTPTDIIFTIGSGEEMKVRYGYPDRQMFRLPMVVNSKMFSGDAVESPEATISYMSHASQSVAQLLANFDEQTTAVADEFRDKIRTVMAETVSFIESIYARGEAVCFEFQWREILRQALARQAVVIYDPDAETRLLDFAYIKIGNALFRHTMLEWATQTSLPLAIYGNGWERHAKFSPYAKGPLAHGPALAEVCRSSFANLQATITGNIHQRIFEGTASGGFFLMRYNLLDFGGAIVNNILPWLRDHRGRPLSDIIGHADLRNDEKLIMRFLMGRWLEKFDTLNDRALELLASYGQVRGILDFLGPDVRHVYFQSCDELKERIEFFRQNPAERGKLVASMQKHLHRWEMATVLRQRMDDVSRYLASVASLTK